MKISRANVALQVTTRLAVVVALSCASIASAQPTPPMSVPPPSAVMQIPILKEVGLDQKLDAQVPLDLTFSDEQGRDVTLGSLFGPRPVVLALVYYECPMLCTEVLNGLVGSLQTLSFNAGQGIRRRRRELRSRRNAGARRAEEAAVREALRPARRRSRHALPDRAARTRSTRSRTPSGFKYKYDPSTDQFAHTGGADRAHARGSRVPVSLRHRVPAARSAAGAGRSGRRPDRHCPSTRRCSTATTTIRKPGSTVWPS